MVRFGHIDSNLYSNFLQFDVIKQDVADGNGADIGVNKQNFRSALHVQKASVNLDFNFVNRATVDSINKVMLNYDWPKVFMKHPSTYVDGMSGYILDFSSYLLPSPPTNPNKVYYKYDTDDADEGISGATEISSSAYAQIADINNQQISVTSTGKKYAYFFFKWFPTIAVDELPTQKISLMLHHPWAYNNSGDNNQGFKIDIYDHDNDSWIEMSRMNYTIQTGSPSNIPSYQHFCVVKPLLQANESFRNWSNYVSPSSNRPLIFRMRNLDDGVVQLRMGFNFVCLLIDGFPVSWTNPRSFNFINQFTGTGYQGKMQLTEL